MSGYCNYAWGTPDVPSAWTHMCDLAPHESGPHECSCGASVLPT